MKLKVFLAVAAICATQSFAIIGIGGHYSPMLGVKMSGMDDKAPITSDKTISLKHEGFDGTMQGFGFKLWIDILPIIDIEATVNFRLGSYDATLYVDDPKGITETKEIPLEIEIGGTPFGKANPKFVAMNGDLSITYPITTIPIIRPYIGGGITYYMNSFVLNSQFVSPLVDGTIQDVISIIAAVDPNNPETIELAQVKAQELGETMKQKVQDQALDEGLKTSIGGHALIGFRLKLPIIPIAAYCNGKFYFGGDYPDEIDPGIFALETGIGFAL